MVTSWCKQNVIPTSSTPFQPNFTWTTKALLRRFLHIWCFPDIPRNKLLQNSSSSLKLASFHHMEGFCVSRIKNMSAKRCKKDKIWEGQVLNQLLSSFEHEFSAYRWDSSVWLNYRPHSVILLSFVLWHKRGGYVSLNPHGARPTQSFEQFHWSVWVFEHTFMYMIHH